MSYGGIRLGEHRLGSAQLAQPGSTGTDKSIVYGYGGIASSERSILYSHGGRVEVARSILYSLDQFWR